MSSGDDSLSDIELDRGLSAAFGAADAGDDSASEQPTIAGTPRGGLLDSLRTAYGVVAAVDLDDSAARDAPGPAPKSTSRYEDRGEIARGGMGVVHHVRDRDLRRSLAMKVLLGRGSGDDASAAQVHPELLNRFLEEAQVTAQLAHPGVVPVHELGVDARGRVFFTMQLVRGKTLSEIIELARAGRDGWTRTRALQVILRVCETLAFAHDKGVIHRDVKPDNVMVGRFGETYLMDWGLAKVLDRADLHDLRLRDADAGALSLVETKRDERGGGGDSPILTMDGVVVGTPAYMPPEQARGAIGDIDERADIYAVGALLYELLTGRAPYVEPGTKVAPRVVLAAVHMGPPKPVREIDPDLPDEIVAVCEKAMARERGDRYASAEALAADIQAFLEGRVVRAYRTGPLVEAQKWVGRNRALAASVAAGLVLALGGSIAFAVHANRAARIERAERVRAEGLRLSARAGNEGEHNPALALGLAIQGAERADDPYGRTALYRALANLNEVATLERHPSYVDAVGMSADGHRLLSFSDYGAQARGELVLWDLDTRTPLRRADAHDGPIARGGYEWSGDRVATRGADDRTVRIWSVVDGTCLRTIALEADAAAVSWDASGELLAVVTSDGRLALWDMADAAPRLAVALDGAGPLAVALRPDGAQVAVEHADATVVVRDAATGAELTRLPAPGPAADAPSRSGRLVWLDGGRLLAVMRSDPAAAPVPGAPPLGWTEVWDVAAGQRVAALGAGDERSACLLADARGRTLALLLAQPDWNGRAAVAWDAVERRELWRVDDVPEQKLHAVSPSGRYVVGGMLSGDVPPFSLTLRDGRSGRVEALLRGHTYGESGATVTDAGLVASTSGDTTVRLWRKASPLTFEGTADWDLAGASLVHLLCGGRRAVVRDAAGRLACRSVPDGASLYALPAGVATEHVTVGVARDRLAVLDPATGRVDILDALDGRRLRELPAPATWQRGDIALLAFSADGTRLLRWSAGSLEVFDPGDGALASRCATDLVPRWPQPVWCPEGRSVLVSMGPDRRVVEVDVADGALVRTFEGVHTGLPTGVAVSGSGAVVATCAADTSLVLWDRATATVLGRVRGLHMGDLLPAFDPSGRFVVVRDNVHTLTLVDVARRRVFAEIDLPGWGGTAFLGADVIAGGAGTVLRIPLDPLAAARRALPRPLLPLELANFDVGDAAERAALVDAYVAWTTAPLRVEAIALDSVAAGDIDRARRCRARIEELGPDGAELLLVRAALELADDDADAALRTLGEAVDAGCGPRSLHHAAFERLRDRAEWPELEERARR